VGSPGERQRIASSAVYPTLPIPSIYAALPPVLLLASAADELYQVPEMPLPLRTRRRLVVISVLATPEVSARKTLSRRRTSFTFSGLRGLTIGIMTSLMRAHINDTS
jgi:hypothetical protein